VASQASLLTTHINLNLRSNLHLSPCCWYGTKPASSGKNDAKIYLSILAVKDIHTSTNEHNEELAGERSTIASPAPGNTPHSILTKGGSRYGEDEALHYGNASNAGMMLDAQLDEEMHSKHPLVTCLTWILAHHSFPSCYEESSDIGRQ